jgi:hypothetical protein|tara:strand:+ start:1696 stop:2250 length:555 start_codon:yes stop_codon:yes gene_type:complete
MSVYYKSTGSTDLLIKENGTSSEKQIKWDADYDGKQTNIKLTIHEDQDENNNRNRSIKHEYITLDNEDLVKMLHIPAQQTPLISRLENDFLRKTQNIGISRVPTPHPNHILHRTINHDSHDDNTMTTRMKKSRKGKPSKKNKKGKQTRKSTKDKKKMTKKIKHLSYRTPSVKTKRIKYLISKEK